MPEEAVYNLVMSDDSTLANYVRSLGGRKARRYWVELREGLDYGSLESFEASSSVLLPLRNRLHMTICSVFYPGEPPMHSGCYDLPPEKALIHKRLMDEKKEIHGNPNLTRVDKITAIKAVSKNLRDIGCICEAELSYSTIGQLYAEEGNGRESLECFHRALAAAEKYRHLSFICQLSGVLGSLHLDQGQIDSMKVYWDKALRSSIQWIIPRQTMRILTFYAHYYAKQGRLSLTHNLFEEALAICKEEDLGQNGIRFELDALNFYAGLGAWDIVGRMLPHIKGTTIEIRLRVLQEDTLKVLRIKQMEARYLMGLGEVERAEKLYNGIMQPLKMLRWPDPYTYCLLERAQGLMDNHEADKALPIIREGYQLAHDTNQPHISARFLMLKAQALLRLGDVAASQQALEMFDQQAASHSEDLRSELIAGDVLRLRFALAKDNDRDVGPAAEAALTRLERTIKNMGASGHGYLWMANCEELRHLLHDLTWEDPEIGYGNEMYWRSIYRMLGSKLRNDRNEKSRVGDAAGNTNFMELFRIQAKDARERIVNRGSVHCVYLEHNDDVRRWTCSEQGIRCEPLDISVNALDALVEKVSKAMATDPLDIEAVPDPQLATDLHTLARALLPPEVFTRSKDVSSEPFFVSTEGLLSKIPFETLNLSSGDEYTPLLMSRDVAYLRHANEFQEIDKRKPGIILVNNNPAWKFRDRTLYGPDLRAILDEGRTMAEALPDAAFLHGDSATKSNLLANWENASFIYLASHFIRDPDVPYLAFVPLANPHNLPGPEASFLDVEDVRAANLECCDVVVLSGCASGAPYIGLHNSSVGFGSAFLDAGAGSVIQTFWNVNDEDAKNLMSSFISSWSSNPTLVIRALSDTKRSFMTGTNGIRHPFNWAAYSVKIGRL
jgi:tetratricopeptide (TPR) repeat protein